MKTLILIGSAIAFVVSLYFLLLAPFASDNNNIEASGTMLFIAAFLLSRWIIVENNDNELSHN